MKKSNTNAAMEEEVAEKVIKDHPHDEMSEIKNFIRKKQLQNRVLKQITDMLVNHVIKNDDTTKNAS